MNFLGRFNPALSLNGCLIFKQRKCALVFLHEINSVNNLTPFYIYLLPAMIASIVR